MQYRRDNLFYVYGDVKKVLEQSISEFENHFSLVENLSNGVINIAIADAIPSWKAWKHDGMSVLASLLDKQEKSEKQEVGNKSEQSWKMDSRTKFWGRQISPF